MLTHSHKPWAYRFAETRSLLFVALAYVVATIGNLLTKPASEWFPMLFAGSVMGVLTYFGVYAILRLQKLNAATLSRETFEGFIAFFFSSGVVLLGLLVGSLILGRGSNLELMYGVSMSAGVCAGSARAWTLRKHFRPRREPTA